MTIPRPAEVNHYLTGVVDMARGDRGGLAYLDISTRGFWRSFWSLLYALPAFVYFWFLRRETVLAETPDAEIGAEFILRAAFSDLVVFVASLLLVALLARPLNMTDRFVQWVVAANWMSLPLYYAWGVQSVVIRALDVTAGMAFLLTALLFTGLLFISYRVYKVALEADGMLAVGLILITNIVALITQLAIE